MNRRTRRRTNLLTRLVQGRTLLHVAGYWCVYHLVLWHLMLLCDVYQQCRNVPLGSLPVPAMQLYASFAQRHASLLICAVALFPLVAWDILRLTHRLVGPLGRFRNCLKMLAKGERVVQVNIRRGDLLGELQDAFNEFLASPYNTRRWVDIALPDEIDPNTDSARADLATRPKSAEEELLDSIAEIQASLWNCRKADVRPEPVPLTASARVASRT